MSHREPQSPAHVFVASELPEDAETIRQGLLEPAAAGVTEEFSLEAISDGLTRSGANFLILATATTNEAALDLVQQLAQQHQLPIIWFSRRDEANLAGRAVRAGATSFVVDGLVSTRIDALVTIASERHRLVAALQAELQKSKDSLAARKIVERAKGLLMQTRGMSEQEAYETLRTMAMRQGKTLRSVCDAVISMSDLLP